MDYKELADRLNNHGPYSTEECARAITELIALAESAESERDQLRESMKPNCILCDSMHPDNGNCTAVGGFCTAVPAAYCPLIPRLRDKLANAEAMAEKAEKERDAAQAIIAQDIGVTGVDAIKTCFGYPLEKVQELVEADKAGKCMVLPLKPGDEVYYIGWSACSQGWDEPEECSGCGYDECDAKRVVKSMRVPNYSWIAGNFIDRENHYYYTSYHAAEAALKGEKDGAVRNS